MLKVRDACNFHNSVNATFSHKGRLRTGYCPGYVVCPLFVFEHFVFGIVRMNLLSCDLGLIISVCAIFCGFLAVVHMPGTCVAHAYHMHYAREHYCGDGSAAPAYM